MNQLLNQDLLHHRAQIDEIIKDLHGLTMEIGNGDLTQTVSDLRNRIKEPFMFVIVGEVKAGKSSFINALLSTGKEICKVAPQPMTDTIQQVIYGEKEEEVIINDYLKKIYHPVDILKEIAIVDTPGTNTIVEHHQEITERFIPASDLIVFVFEAKNPYRQSAWEFFDYIHSEWRKKIIFILQQKDLMNENDLKVNENGVHEYAEKKGILAPNVFAVSAKMELEKQEDTSGFQSVRNFIQENITGGKAPILKLQNNIEISENINERIFKGVTDRKNQWEADIEFRQDIRETLAQQAEKSKRQVGILVENLVAGYDRITNQKEDELKEGLSLFTLMKRAFASIFTKEASSKIWLETLANDLEKDLKTSLQDKLSTGINDLADSIQQMAKMIDLKIQNSQTILKNDHALFADIAERRANVMKDLHEAFAAFMNNSENFKDENLMGNEPIAQNLMSGSGIAVLGAVIMAVAQTAAFDITGGILTSIGLLFASISTTIGKRKVINAFHAELEKGRTRLENEMSQKLNDYISVLKNRIDKNFENFDELLEKEQEQIEELMGRQKHIEGRLLAIKASLN